MSTASWARTGSRILLTSFFDGFDRCDEFFEHSRVDSHTPRAVPNGWQLSDAHESLDGAARTVEGDGDLFVAQLLWMSGYQFHTNDVREVSNE